MLQGLRASLRSITRRIKGRNGNGMLWCMFLAVAIIILFLPFFEKWRVHILTDEASKKITATLTSVASSHMYDSYSPVRDGTSGAFVFDGAGFTEIKDIEGFFNLFIQLQKNTRRQGDSLVRLQAGDRAIYEIADIRIFVQNAVGSNLRSKYHIEYTLKIPQELLWKNSVIILENQVQTAQYKDKY